VARCPTCKRPLPESAPQTLLPFCSQRCKLADLGSWLSDRYVVSEALSSDEVEALAASGDE
jgi:endogenous inhibitor of DNA gyrase (YacG/DUF329 family)